ncbi:MAG: hypothetical protein Q8L98_07760 [Chlamydiales bacterium]|nr:hypothetical protein [Chlamydiales bacterium]
MEIDLRNSLSFNGIFNNLAVSSVEKQKIAQSDYAVSAAQTSYNFQQITFNATTVGIVAAVVFATFSYLSIPVSGLAIGAFWFTRQVIVADINRFLSSPKDVDESENSEKIQSKIEIYHVSVPFDWKAVAHKIVWPFSIVLWRNTIPAEKLVKFSVSEEGYAPRQQYQ